MRLSSFIRTARAATGRLLATACAMAVSAGTAGAQGTVANQPARDFEAEARRILAATPLIDGHNDLAEQLRDRWSNHLDRIDLAAEASALSPPLHTDIPRLRRGAVGGVFLAAYVPASLEGPAAVPVLFEQIDVIQRLVERYAKDLSLALTAADVERIHRGGKIAALIGIENGGAIDNSLGVLRQAYICGARYLTLTHLKNTDWADATDWPLVAPNLPAHGGLSAFGQEVVREMNRLGMLVDLSHTSDQTARAALKTSQAPVIFSHSAARALCNHSRNVPDEILRLLAANDGVVMIAFVPEFISEQVRIAEQPGDAEWRRLSDLYPGDSTRAAKEWDMWRLANPAALRATVSQVADHIDHVRRVVGIDHVGVGSDFDGFEGAIVGLEDVSRYPTLFAELLRRGYTATEVRKVAGENILRVMREAERVAARLRRERPASDVLITDLDAPPAPPVASR